MQRGFTLVEMAVVALIIGLLMSAVMSMTSAQMLNAQIEMTRRKAQAAKTALTTFVARYNRLPCPAVGSAAQGTAGYGREAATPGTCTGAVSTDGVVTGVLPWVELGLSDDAASDAFGQRFTYSVTAAATDLNAEKVAGMKGNIDIHSATPVAAANLINSGNPAVVMIVSHGKNGYGAYVPGSGIQRSMPADSDELEVANAGKAFVVKDYSDSYDDLILSLAPDDILTPLFNNGTLLSPRAITNNRIREAQDALIAQITNAGGAVPPSMPVSISDGWGNPISYFRNLTSVCGAASGQKTFELRSNGPNGTTTAGDLDDISVLQNNDQLKAHIQKTGAAC